MWTHGSRLQVIMQSLLSHLLVVFQSFNGSSHLYYDWSNIGNNPRVWVMIHITYDDIFRMKML
jgi:hypothetical protein